MMDHDQRLKSLIELFLHEFFELFFPQWADDLDLKQPTWIRTEVFNDPPVGSRRFLDLLAKVPIKNPTLVNEAQSTESLALVHMEIEAKDSTTTATKQLWDNYHALRLKYSLPVLPVALFLNVGRNGIAIEEYHETFASLRMATFRYLSVGLPRLNAIQYVEGDNLLGLALTPFMDIPADQTIEVGGKALLKIAASNVTEQQRYLLAECIQAYLPLLPEDQDRFIELQATPAFSGVKAMNLTWHDKGIIKGKIEGRIEGQAEMLANQIRIKFGVQPAKVMPQLDRLSTEQLLALSEKVLVATTFQELGLA